PVSGQTLINARVVQRLKQLDVRIRLVDTSPRSRLRMTFLYHFRRWTRMCWVLYVLGTNALEKRRCLYTAVEPGYGMLYNFIVVTFARIFRYQLFLHHHSASYAKSYERRFAKLCSLAGKKAIHIVLSEQMAYDLTTLYPSVHAVVGHNASHI